jgi:uracil-DNA glycosylase family 4
MLQRHVPGVGPGEGIMIVGEFPGQDEVKSGVPFTNFAGKTVRRKLNESGVNPEHVRYENVFEYVPAGNIRSYYKDRGCYQPGPELALWQKELYKRIEEFKPKVIVALGDTAMRTLCFPEHWHIKKSSCYVIKNNKVNVPVIPLFHQSYVNYDPAYVVWMGVAMQKAKMILDGKVQFGDEKFLPRPSYQEILEYIKMAKDSDILCIDIEKTISTNELTAVGIAVSPFSAISIPWGCWPEEQERVILNNLQELFSGPARKVFQNFAFDCMVLWQKGMPVSGPYADTMELSTLLNPQLAKGLADLGRLYLFIEPWKHKGAWSQKGQTEEQFGLYNCKDCAYTLQVYNAQMEALKEQNLLDYYLTYREPLYAPVLRTCLRGWNIDHNALANLNSDLEQRLAPIVDSLTSEAVPFLKPVVRSKKLRDKEKDVSTGKVVTAEYWKAASKKERERYVRDRKTGELFEKAWKEEEYEEDREFNPNSSKQVGDILKEMGIKLPTTMRKRSDGTKESTESTDNKSLLKLARKYPENKFIQELREYRKLEKLRGTYGQVRLDPDNRMRFQITVAGTENGRFSSKQTPWGTGLNSQNLPREFRHVVVPDDGMTLMQVDLKQAELFMVAWLSQDEKLIDMLENGKDVHQLMADIVTEETGLQADRKLGKEINHATSYGIGPDKFAERLLVRCGISITRSDAKKIIDLRFREFPGIPKWQDLVAKRIREKRQLKNPFGRVRPFWGRLDDSLVREALNFVPQSTVADVLNAAWIEIEKMSCFHTSHVIQQGHDSLLIQTSHVKECKKAIDEAFGKIKFVLWNKECQIPWEVSAGPNWRDQEEIVC